MGILAMSGLAWSAPLAIVLGARELWRPDCDLAAQGPEACRLEGQGLHFADDDAWRMAWFLQTVTPPERIRVLAELDQSTADRRFPGGAPSLPTRAALLASLSELRGDPLGPPQTVIVALAAHGSESDIHLADGPHDFAALRRDMTSRLGPQDRLLLVADVCLSARWRSASPSGPASTAFPPVSRGGPRSIEVVVEGRTPEWEDIEGGAFTWLAISAWMGGGDADQDDQVSAQELQDHIFRYVAPGIGALMSPEVRAPSPQSPLPPTSRGAHLELGEAEASRWVIFVEGPGQEAIPLGEVFTGPREHRRASLPPGAYLIVQLPAEMGGWQRSWVSQRSRASLHRLSLAEGEDRELSGPGEAVDLTSRGTRSELSTALRQLPVSSLDPLPLHQHRYHGGDLWWLGLGAGWSPLALEGLGSAVLGELSLRRPSPGGRWQGELGLGLGAQVEPGAPELGLLHAGLGADRLLWSRPSAWLGLSGRLGLELGRLSLPYGAEELQYGYLALGPELGPSLHLRQGQWGLRLGAQWSPRWLQVDDEGKESLASWDVDAAGLRAGLGMERAW